MSDVGQFDKASSKNMLHLPRNIYEHIEWIRPHLAKCIGEARSIENLRTYLDGNQVALAINYVEEPDHPPIGLFLSWLAETQPGAWEHGWARDPIASIRTIGTTGAWISQDGPYMRLVTRGGFC